MASRGDASTGRLAMIARCSTCIDNVWATGFHCYLELLHAGYGPQALHCKLELMHAGCGPRALHCKLELLHAKYGPQALHCKLEQVCAGQPTCSIEEAMPVQCNKLRVPVWFREA